MANANVYIDGFNLYYGAVKNTPYRWLDLLQLCRLMTPNDNIREIKYFTARVSSRPHDPDAPTRQQIYLRALRTLPNLQIFYGHFLTHSCRMVLTGINPVQKVWVDKTEEKGSDVNLATYLLRDAYNHAFDVAVLVTNDSDLVEPIKIVRKEIGLPVGILNPHRGRHSQQLQQIATFIKRIRQSDVAACQFPPILTDRKGQFHKPAAW
jgi:uncharacterized LabA/DUF88 family protein